MENKDLKYYDIVTDVVNDIVGKSKKLNIIKKSKSIYVDWDNCDMDCSFSINDSEGKYIIENMMFDDLTFFKSFVKQKVENKLIPKIYDMYKKNKINILPSKLESKNIKIDFTKINTKWLENKFHEISEMNMNGENIDNIDIKYSKKDCIITFELDCNRYGIYRDCNIKINDKGSVSVNLDETPIEGCGIEGDLEEAIYDLITS